MEWLLVLAAVACPVGMLAMGGIAWMLGKRGARSSKADGEARAAGEADASEGALTPRA